MKKFCVGIIGTMFFGCSGSSGPSGTTVNAVTATTGVSVSSTTGLWETECTSVSGTYVISSLRLGTSSDFSESTKTYSDAGCSSQTSISETSGTYGLGEDPEDDGEEQEINFFASDGEDFYDIIAFSGSTLTLGKKDAEHDGLTAAKRPVELDTNLVFKRDVTSPSTNPTTGGGSSADCGTSDGATVTISYSNSTFSTAPTSSDLLCGSYHSTLGASSIVFDKAVANRSGSGNNYPVQIGGMEYPVKLKTYNCDIIINDNNGTAMSADGGDCSVTITSVSGNSVTGTFTAKDFYALGKSSTLGSVSGTFSIKAD